MEKGDAGAARFALGVENRSCVTEPPSLAAELRPWEVCAAVNVSVLKGTRQSPGRC